MFHVEHSIGEPGIQMSDQVISMNTQNVVTPPRKRAIWIALLSLLTCLSACSRPNPEPEKLDPIYLDLKAEEAKAQTAVEVLSEEIKAAKDELAKLPPRDPGRRKAEQDLRNRASQLVQVEQMQLYYQIRAKQRVAYAREEYLKAFERDQPWPKPEDFDAYKKSKELRAVDKNWGSRVPKQTRYNKTPEADVKKQLEDAQKAPH
jgi:hypothetical protein